MIGGGNPCHAPLIPPSLRPHATHTQACTASGTVGLFLLRASRVTATAAGTEILLSLEPAPPSRHIFDGSARSCAVASPPAPPPAETGSPRRSDDGDAPAPDAGAAPRYPWGLVGCPLGRRAGSSGDGGGGGDGRGAGARTAAEVAVVAGEFGEEATAALFQPPRPEALTSLRSGSLRAWWLESGWQVAGGGAEGGGKGKEDGSEQQQQRSASPSRQPVIPQQLAVAVASPQQQPACPGLLSLSPLALAAEPWLDVSMLEGMFANDRWEELDLGALNQGGGQEGGGHVIGDNWVGLEAPSDP